jgi:hypothetical protein
MGAYRHIIGFCMCYKGTESVTICPLPSLICFHMDMGHVPRECMKREYDCIESWFRYVPCGHKCRHVQDMDFTAREQVHCSPSKQIPLV